MKNQRQIIFNFSAMMQYSVLNAPRETDCLIVPVFENANLDKRLKELDKRFSGLLQFIVDSKDFEGKRMQTSLLYRQDETAPRILLLGLGKEEEVSIRNWKHAVGAAIIQAQSKKIKRLSFVIPKTLCDKIGPFKMAYETVIAAELGSYSYDAHKKQESRVVHFESFDFVEIEDKKMKKEMERGIDEALIVAEATNYVRELGNTPPHIMTPTYLAHEAEKLNKENKKISVEILSKSQIKKLGMGCFLGVAQGSKEEPKFIIMEYLAGKKNEKPIALVGKGITFDSGGISLKPGDYLLDMKFDMLGGATVMGVIRAAAKLGIKKNIIGLVPACENMPSGEAYRPDDILIAMNGLSVEVVNTDAEGRLILADALCYATKYNPKEVFDFATLTGHCLVALGNERSGLFTQHDQLAEKLSLAAQTVGEYVWRLPMGEEFTDAVKAEVADLKNGGGVGSSRYGGASIGAAFLEHFVSYPWAHIDLSCSHYGGKGKPWIRGGANGFGVQTMIEYLRK